MAGTIGADADELVCVDTPRGFCAIGQFYANFAQVSDEEVIACLERAAAPPSPAQASTVRAAAAADPPGREQEVRPEAGVVRLAGYLTVPENAPGIVVFAHGSGSSRHSPRNRYVAGVLNDAGLGTLLFDLLTPGEEADRANVFDIGLLAGRLAEVTSWLRAQPRAAHAAIGYFGASTGAAAALWAAAEPGAGIAAVVSRGGRPDLARPRLAAVTAPTLLIVGGRDEVVLDLNRRPRRSYAARTAWPSCPAPPTCSKSRAPSTPPPGWPGTGSSATSRPSPASKGGTDRGPAPIQAAACTAK